MESEATGNRYMTNGNAATWQKFPAPWHHEAQHHAVAGVAGDAVAPERRIMRKLAHLVAGLERNRIQVRTRKRRALAVLRMPVDRKLALTLHGVAAEAGVLDGRRRFRME